MAKEKEVSKLEELVDNVASKVGKGMLKLLSKGFERQPCNGFGLCSLDSVLNGGIVHGTMLEMYGSEGGGKTTAALTLISQAIKDGHMAIILDAEQKLDPVLARNLGVDLSKDVALGQPSSAEECFKIIEAALDTMKPGDIILVDSVAALVPESQIEAGIGGKSYAGNSAAISSGINLIRNKVGEKGAIIIFINQIREKIGVVYGSNLTTPGGHGLKHACETRLEVNRSSLIKDGDKVIGQEVNIKVIKSAHSSPYQVINLELYFGKGFSKERSLLDIAKTCGIVTGAGSWFEMNGKKYHGEKEILDYLATPEGYADILGKVKV